MMFPSLVRTAALALGLTFTTACMTTAPRPIQAGDWHFGGSSGGLWSKTDGGDFGDTQTFDAQITGGRFVTDQVHVEGIVGVSDSNFEDSSGDESDVTTMKLGAGARYYPSPEGASRPYIGLRGGFSHINVDDDFTGTDESDTSPFLEARLGLEAMLGANAAVDLGLSWEQIFSRQLGSVDEDFTTFGLFVGFSIWL
jgi:hypothetical protein